MKNSIVFSELDAKSLFFYSAKWFAIWSFWLFSIGMMAVVTIIAFLAACCNQATKDENH